jgi:hypothetical protein
MTCRHETYSIVNNCPSGGVTFQITIANDVNRAFQIQLIDGVSGVNRTGVTLTIEQDVHGDGRRHSYLRWGGGGLGNLKVVS